MKVLAWYIDLNGIENKNIVKYPYPTSIQKTWFLYYKTQMTFKSDNTNPTLVSTWIYISYTFKHTILLRQKMSYDPTNQLQNSEINVGNQYTASFGPNKMLWQNKELKKSCTTKLSVEYIQRVQLILRFCIKSSSIGVYRHTEISLDCWFNAMWTHDFDRIQHWQITLMCYLNQNPLNSNINTDFRLIQSHQTATYAYQK